MQQAQILTDRATARPRFAAGLIHQGNKSEIAVVTAPVAEGNVEVGAAGREGLRHAFGIRIELPRPEPMVDPLILLLFVVPVQLPGGWGFTCYQTAW